MRKKLFYLFVLLMTTVFLAGNAGATTFTDDGGLQYTLTPSDGTGAATASVAGYTGSSGEVVIPSTVETGGVSYTVILIEPFAFEELEIESVVIPDTVEKIGAEAFLYCSSLRSVTIGSGVKAIYREAFSGCSSLESIVIPGSVSTIGEGAFSSCTSLGNIVLKDGIRSIGDSAFRNCTALTELHLPFTVNEIGNYAFARCGNLTGIALPRHIKTIGSYAFLDCTSLTTVTFDGQADRIGGGSFKNCTKLSDITLPNGLLSIERELFSGCTSLKSVTLPDTATSIADSAFLNCSSLGSIVFPEKIKTIGTNAFSGCTGLSTVELRYDISCSYAFPNTTTITYSKTLPAPTGLYWNGSIAKWDKHPAEGKADINYQVKLYRVEWNSVTGSYTYQKIRETTIRDLECDLMELAGNYYFVEGSDYCFSVTAMADGHTSSAEARSPIVTYQNGSLPTVTIISIGNGRVNIDKPYAKKGETVTLSAPGSTLGSFGKIAPSNEGVALTPNEDGSYSFVMPGNPVVLTAEVEFNAIPGITILNAPKLSPASGSYTGSIYVTIGEYSHDVTICYTTDGSHPLTSDTKKFYTGPFLLNKSAVVRAIAVDENNISSITEVEYTIMGAVTIVVPPTLIPSGGSFTDTQEVTLSCPILNAVLYYTLDGSDPTDSDTRIKYTEPFTLTKTTTVKAVAVRGKDASRVISATFTKQETALVSLLSGKVSLTLAGNPECTVTVAVYDERGKMLAAGTETVTENMGSLTVTTGAFDPREVKTVRLFYLDKTYVPVLPMTELMGAQS